MTRRVQDARRRGEEHASVHNNTPRSQLCDITPRRIHMDNDSFQIKCLTHVQLHYLEFGRLVQYTATYIEPRLVGGFHGGLFPESSPIEAAHALIWLTAEGLHSLARMGRVGHARCHRTSG